MKQIKLKYNRIFKIIRYSWYVLVLSQLFVTEISYGARIMNAAMFSIIGCISMIGYDAIAKLSRRD